MWGLGDERGERGGERVGVEIEEGEVERGGGKEVKEVRRKGRREKVEALMKEGRRKTI